MTYNTIIDNNDINSFQIVICLFEINIIFWDDTFAKCHIIISKYNKLTKLCTENLS